MPQSIATLQVSGSVAADSGGAMLVLSERIEGHDTFLTGQLEVVGMADRFGVQILTFDDVSVLRFTGEVPTSLPQAWSGVLHLPHGWRPREIPTDLAASASETRRDLGALDAAELRYALTFLDEATTEEIRRDRIDAIVKALPLASGGM